MESRGGRGSEQGSAVGSRFLPPADSLDFSAITLTQIKRQEMDSQVRVLELESQLQKERRRLGELRKKHYELAGVAEGWEESDGLLPASQGLLVP
ncbi:hypothetical protein JRQ81_008219 [Phrynocephalus forsythii]|uniref:I/LWEQ domain-containing protein n=1 Tax=Phrynocephalus forsythii TaxID=171643 RepID=A0A9Q0XC05_9SAUR|nr:hypothetical protein JRQ81_008219 [Phrynocephalus forsythii]